MKNLTFLILITLTSCGLSCGLESSTNVNNGHLKDNDTKFNVQLDMEIQKPMTITVQLPTSSFENGGDVIIKVEYKNVSSKNQRLLDLFSDIEDLKVNHLMVISFDDGSGTILTPLPGQLTDFGPGHSFKYIVLLPNKSVVKTFNIGEIVRQAELPQLTSGKYKVQLIYLNKYGENCIKGKFESNIISFNVK